MTDDSGTSVAISINGTFTKWALGVFATMIALAVGFLINVEIRQEQRLDKLERFEASTAANRFTQADGLKLWRDVLTYIETNVPPPEVGLRLQMLEDRLERIER